MARRGTTLLALAALQVLLLLATSFAASATPAPATTLTLSQPGPGKAGLPVSFTATLVDDANAPIAGATVVLQQGPSWTTAATGTTNGQGQATLTATRPLGTATWRAFYDGDDVTHAGSTSATVSTTGLRYASTLTIAGPARLVDEHSARLGFTWTASDLSPVAGRIVVYRKLGTGPWTAYGALTTTAAGVASLVVTPRVDSAWRAVGAAGPWWLGAASPTLSIDNLPSGIPVTYPAAAPRPAYTPPQARATGSGAYPVVTRIPASTWRTMLGRTWHRGCLGRSRLRLLRVNYWGFDGYRYRGEMVLRNGVAQRAGAALRDMYNRKLPIRRMYREDRFGWSRRLHGANDYASMRADNSSGFNCRTVVNKPGVRSPHASGRAVDLNTWENPYRSATGLVPDSWWAGHSDPRIAWRSSSHAVIRIWRSHGFRWTYANVDSQHLDGRTAALAGSFVG